MAEQLTAQATHTEAQIFNFSPFDSSSNPTGVKNGEIYFSIDTKKIFLAIVDGGVLTWRIIESSSTSTSTAPSEILATNPTVWVDANTPYSVNDATEGDHVSAVMDLSGNDFHFAQNMMSKQFTLSKHMNVNYFDNGSSGYAAIRYRCAADILSELGMRIGQGLSVSGTAASSLVVFKLNGPFAMGTGDDHSGGTFAGDKHYKKYEDCVSFAERSNCGSELIHAWGPMPFYYKSSWLTNYDHISSAKHGGIFYTNMFASKTSYIHPKAGIFNDCHGRWNTLFFRTSGDGSCFEILLNGKNFVALSRAMKEGASKTGAQLDWVTTAPTANFSTATNDKWEVNTETQVKTTHFIKQGANYWHHPYVEPGYEYYPMDGLDGGDSGTANNNQASTGVRTSDGRVASANDGQTVLYNDTRLKYDGANNIGTWLKTSSVSVDAASNHFDLVGDSRSDFSEFVQWKRRLTDEERNKVLNEIHSKYANLGGGMPALPGSSAAGNSGGMMPSKGSVFDAPWI